MQVSKEEANTIKRAVSHWRDVGMISGEESQKLLASYEVVSFDWKRVAEYSFWLAMMCIVISVAAALADKWLIELFTKIFNAPDLVKCVAFAAIAAGLYAFGAIRKARFPEKVYSNEAVFFLGITATAVAVGFFGKVTGTIYGHFTYLLLIAAVIYGALALWFRSSLVWLFSLLALGTWLGAETGYRSGWGAYYLGMNYPLRLALFSTVLILVGEVLFSRWHSRSALLRPTRAVGLLCLLCALWILSIFGNYGDVRSWGEVRQIEFLHWSVLLAIASAVSLYHGMKYDDAMTRGLGLIFLIINLYTRFFEYFWEGLHKAAFFALLALSFWYLGSRAERIWQLSLGKSLEHRAPPGGSSKSDASNSDSTTTSTRGTGDA